MLPRQRHELIVRTLRREGPAAVRALAERLGVSQATVRRDLLQLDREGLLTRVYGGAMSATDYDEPFAEIATVHVQEKDDDRRAVRGAHQGRRHHPARHRHDGTSICACAARSHGHGRSRATSRSMRSWSTTTTSSCSCSVGWCGAVTARLVGYLTEDALRQVRADRLFLGTSGVRPDGQVMDTTVVEVPIKRAMIAASDQVVLLADASKFPGTGVARVCGPQELHVVVTNAPADPVTRAALTDAGVEVIEA